MGQPIVTLTHPSINGGVAVRVLCDKVNVAGKKNVKADPQANGTAQAEAQTQTVENLVYTLTNVHLTNASNTLTYQNILALYRARYGGTSAAGSLVAATLNVKYDKTGSTNLVGFDGVTTNIKVVMKDFNFPIDVKDSVAGYMPVVTLNFVETA